MDSISASSGSPPANIYHPTAPMNQLRDMLLTDMDHSNSNDHNDVKDLSFRNQPQQAAVITSTAPPIVHLDSSNHDFDSSRASSVHVDNGPTTENNVDGGVLRSVRVRKLSESSHNTDTEHHNYKFKNYIQQRFSQDNSGGSHHIDVDHHDDIVNGTGSSMHRNDAVQDGDKSPHDMATVRAAKKAKLYSDFAECSSCDEARPTTNGITEFKSEPLSNPYQLFTKPSMNGARYAHTPVPIFALHAQGRHYVPLNVDYEALVPYLGGCDLFDKSCRDPMLPCHSININVNFVPATARSKLASTFNGRSKVDNSHNIMCNGW